MSQENVEVLRRIYDAWNHGDPGLDLFDPVFELHQTSLIDTARVFRGQDAPVQAARELLNGLRDLSWHPEDFIVGPGNQVVVPYQFGGTGRSEGVPVEMKLVHVWTFKNGLAVRCMTYEDLPQALEAVGLAQ